ncbi:hypothetical protein LIA77_01136 [Sarocladium implicatum]|nr:hypothetical protein LIA77_01136 [Sarocladium implicatum]
MQATPTHMQSKSQAGRRTWQGSAVRATHTHLSPMHCPSWGEIDSVVRHAGAPALLSPPEDDLRFAPGCHFNGSYDRSTFRGGNCSFSLDLWNANERLTDEPHRERKTKDIFKTHDKVSQHNTGPHPQKSKNLISHLL